MDIPRNYNRHLTSEPHNYERVQNAFNSLMKGIITNTYGIKGKLGCFYDVKLLTSNITLRGVQSITKDGGLNGEGEYFSYDVDTPVLVLCTDGKLGQGEAYIFSAFTTVGSYDSFYKEGNLQDYNERLNGAMFSQPFNHPNRIAQEDAYFKVVNVRNLESPYNNPDFYSSSDSERDIARARPGYIEMHNRDGTSVYYNSSDSVHYTDGNHIIVSAGHRKSKCEVYMDLAKRHLNKSKLYSGKFEDIPEIEQQDKEIQSPVSLVSSTSDFVLDNQYLALQEYKLATIYCGLAKQCSTTDYSRQNVLSSMNQTLFNQVGSGNLITDNFKPKESSIVPARGNYNNVRKFKEEELPELIIVLHETVVSYEGAKSIMTNGSYQASYHVLLKRDGEVVYVVDPDKSAYSNGPSAYKGVKYGTSVNSFSYNISFVSPSDGYGNELTHSGYTEEQYRSAAWVISRTGISRDRITTHEQVAKEAGRTDRIDPRSFDYSKLNYYLNQFPSERVINFGI